MSNNKTVVMCPYCKTYWSGISQENNYVITEYGLTNLNSAVECLTCGRYYIPSVTACEMYDFVADNFMKVKG